MDEIPQCKYCYTNKGKLLSLCSCKGSVKWVHRRCAERWIRIKQDIKCPICKQDQSIHISIKHIWQVVTMDDVNFLMHILFFISYGILLSILIFKLILVFFFSEYTFRKSVSITFFYEFSCFQSAKLCYYIYLYIRDIIGYRKVMRELSYLASLVMLHEYSTLAMIQIFSYSLMSYIITYLFIILSRPHVSKLLRSRWQEIKFHPYETIKKGKHKKYIYS